MTEKIKKKHFFGGDCPFCVLWVIGLNLCKNLRYTRAFRALTLLGFDNEQNFELKNKTKNKPNSPVAKKKHCADGPMFFNHFITSYYVVLS